MACMSRLPSHHLRRASCYNLTQEQSIRQTGWKSAPRNCQPSNRDLGFDGVVIGAHAAVRGVEQAGGCQGLDVRMNIAVVATESLCEGANACDFVPADVAQQLHPFAGQHACEDRKSTRLNSSHVS